MQRALLVGLEDLLDRQPEEPVDPDRERKARIEVTHLQRIRPEADDQPDGWER